MHSSIQSKKMQYVLSCCLFAALFGYAAFHAYRGLNFKEEGMWISTAMRYTLGDVPFRDEVLNTMRWADLLTSPLFRIFPDISLGQLRCVGLAIQFAGITALFLLMSRYAPPLFVALVCGVAFLLHDNNGGFQAHRLLSGTFSLLSLTCWLSASITERSLYRTLFAIGGGLCCSLYIFSYNPKLLIVAAPVLALIFGFFVPAHRHPFRRSSVIFFFTLGSIFILVFILLFFSGFWQDYVEAVNLFISRMAGENMRDEIPTVPRIEGLGLLLQTPLQFIRQSLLFRGVGAGTLVFLMLSIIGLLLLIHRISKDMRVALGVMILLTVYAVFPLPLKLKILSFSCLVALLCVFLDSANDPDPRWRLVRNYAILWGFMDAGVYWISSGSSSALKSIVILLVVGMVAIYRFVKYAAIFDDAHVWHRRTCMGLLYLMPLPFLFSGLDYGQYKYLYKAMDASPEYLTAQFTHPKLKGVYSSPKKVAIVEELLQYLDTKVDPGDYFLIYPTGSLLYFLTHTRPAYQTAWADYTWGELTDNYFIHNMISRERVPEYCVRRLTNMKDDWDVPLIYKHFPLDNFLQENYSLEKTIYPFEIWRHKSLANHL